MSKRKMKVMTVETIERQRRYVDRRKSNGHGLGVVFADAFLRGMRDLGYKDPAWSIAEQIDNAFQAAADTVSIRLGFNPGNDAQTKPDQVAICDNGNGMIPEMISYAVRWGGTDREGDRNGFGRYGYGLPSSAVSLAKRYTVYSKASGGSWHAVTVDIDELAAVAGDLESTEDMLRPRPAKLPTWVVSARKGDDTLDLGQVDSGTLVVLEDLDRLRRLSGWIKAESLRTKLLQQLGVIYRHWIPERRIFIDGVEAQAVDPLFLLEHGRFFDETPVRALRVEARTFEVETSRGTKGTVRIRAAVLPPNFQLVDPAQYASKGAKTNKRWDVMRGYNGLLVCRERRQIDCIAPRWTRFQTYDMNVKIEIDFDPELDEFFGITTSKQQITIDDMMWERLQQDGRNGGALVALVKDLRRRFEEMQQELNAKAENRAVHGEPRPSARAMEQSEKFKGFAREPTEAQREEAQENLKRAAAERAEVTGESVAAAMDALAAATSERRWEVKFEAIPEGPFYRPHRLGEQKQVKINTEHPFYKTIYDVSTPDVRAALEVLLFVLAERELEVKSDAERFYRSERQSWSERLRLALTTLVPSESMVNKAAAIAERMHTAMDDTLAASEAQEEQR